MDFLEDLFDFGDRKRRAKGGLFQNGNQHDDEHDDEHDHRYPNPNSAYPQAATHGAVFLPGGLCSKCSRQTVQGAKFCHECGAAVVMNTNCASCGSKLPANALFCSQCGYKNG
jgi:ribosomal protein L40E